MYSRQKECPKWSVIDLTSRAGLRGVEWDMLQLVLKSAYKENVYKYKEKLIGKDST